jgi:hypothetical protein
MKKKTLSILLLFAILASLFTLTATTTTANNSQIPPYSCGDVNGDGFITITDALEILKYLAGLSSNMLSVDPAAMNAARLVSGRVNGESPAIGDVLEILKRLAGLNSVFDSFTCPECDWCNPQEDIPMTTTVTTTPPTTIVTTVTTQPTTLTTTTGTSRTTFPTTVTTTTGRTGGTGADAFCSICRAWGHWARHDPICESCFRQSIAATTTTSATTNITPPTTVITTVTTPATTVTTPPIANDNRRIRINSQNQFVVGAQNNERRIWINGVNTPWNNWNDFGGNFNAQWWDTHFATLRANNVNSSRVWISCTNNQGNVNNNNGPRPIVTIGANGMVTGVNPLHWQHLDEFFRIAERHQIYIMATFISFDHFKHDAWHNAGYQSWRSMIRSTAAINSYIQHYTIPFVQRYGSNPYLWSIDLINEPDWIHENQECGRMAWDDICRFIALNAAAIRENSNVLVTVGMASSKYNSPHTAEGNVVSDANLRRLANNNANARLDFWSPHYYDWVGEWFGHPFTSRPFGTRAQGGWQLDPSKPAIIGETSGRGSRTRPANQSGSLAFTLLQDYVNAFNNGWQGVMAWTSNNAGAGDYGDINVIRVATNELHRLHPNLIWPLR